MSKKELDIDPDQVISLLSEEDLDNKTDYDEKPENLQYFCGSILLFGFCSIDTKESR